MVVTALIRADLMVYQEATAPVIISTMVATRATGGLPQSPMATLGNVDCTSTTTVSTEAWTVTPAATQLVVSGIKNFKL